MNYDVVTWEYKASCTVWKAAQVLNFEDVLKQYEPMISASLRKLNIYRDHDSFRQAARVALWHALNRFDETKGNFTPFAYRSIRGAMLDEIKKENKFEENVTQMEDEALVYIIETEFDVHYGATNGLAEALDILPPAERELIHWLFIEGFTLSECAERIGITVAGIKKRRQRILAKLRREFV
ncbi:MAG TPA: sigma-70 family RNA polymerase sigma factor [Sporosarcina psychrophila]|uniref:Sigma-70 family RNA polymerase sigma factor n=1 Tax=Sporosarcina psychrophila TaxID=1476 RepID=A0A921KE63_SPOPS|nr:sigma-70 family RNA polymerase sigma factor [Sporosarcina psychrophila]